MSNQSNKIYMKNKDLPWQTFDEETIVIDPDGQNSFELNLMGSFIWKRINGENTLSEIQKTICEEFDAREEEVFDDLSLLLDEMHKKNMITEKD